MEQLIYEIAGRKYLLVEVPIAEGKGSKMDKMMVKYECIHQGIKEIKRSFWSNGYVISKWLVPESNLMAFNKELNNIKQ